MSSWRQSIRKVFDPSPGGVKTNSVILLGGSAVNLKHYGNFRNPVCAMSQAVIAEFEKNFDIIAFYTDIDVENHKKGLNFYKGKDEYLALTTNPPDSTTLPQPPPGVSTPYILARYKSLNTTYLKAKEDGRKDRLAPEATYYDNDPNLMMQHLQRDLFQQKEKSALVIFDEWIHWGDTLFYKDPDTRMQKNRATIDIFRKWVSEDRLTENGHLIVVLAPRQQGSDGNSNRYIAPGSMEELKQDLFSRPNCVEIPVTAPGEEEVRNALLGAHFLKYKGFHLEQEHEAEDIATTFVESGIIASDGLKIISDLGQTNTPIKLKTIEDKYGSKLGTDVTLDDVIGYNKLKKELLKKVIGKDFKLEHAYNIMKRKRKSKSRGVIFAGVGGCGKSYMAKALVGTLRRDYGKEWQQIKIESASQMTSKYRGESEERIVETFNSIKSKKKAVIIWDEAEAYLKAAASVTGSGAESEDNKARSAILRGIEELANMMDKDESRHYFWVVTTNKPSLIDEASKRRLSNGIIYYVGLPDFQSRVDLLKHLSIESASEIWDDSFIEYVAKNTNGTSTDILRNKIFDDIEELIAQMVVNQGISSSEDLENLKIEYDLLKKYFKSEVPRINQTENYREVIEDCKRADCKLIDEQLELAITSKPAMMESGR